MADLPPLLTDLSLAAHLGATPRAVAEKCRRGEIPGTKIGRRWVIRRESFLAYLERQERRRRPPSAAESDAARLLEALPPPRRRRRPPPSP